MDVHSISYCNGFNFLTVPDLNTLPSAGKIFVMYSNTNNTDPSSNDPIVGVETPQGTRIEYPTETILDFGLNALDTKAIVIDVVVCFGGLVSPLFGDLA